MDIEEFLLEMADSDECRRINYKRLAIRKYIGVYYAQKPVPGKIDSFMIPFRDYVKCKIEEYEIDIDALAKYMISTAHICQPSPVPLHYLHLQPDSSPRKVLRHINIMMQ